MKAYLIRAIHEWCIDNGYRPYILINASVPNTEVPKHIIENGKVVLSLNPRAAVNLSLGNDFITFGSSFSQVHYDIKIPIQAILAVYAKETGQGMVFDAESVMEPPAQEKTPTKQRPTLTIVK